MPHCRRAPLHVRSYATDPECPGDGDRSRSGSALLWESCVRVWQTLASTFTNALAREEWMLGYTSEGGDIGSGWRTLGNWTIRSMTCGPQSATVGPPPRDAGDDRLRKLLFPCVFICVLTAPTARVLF